LDQQTSLHVPIDVTMEGPHTRVVVHEPNDGVSKGLHRGRVAADGVCGANRRFTRQVTSLATTNNPELMTMLIQQMKAKSQQKDVQQQRLSDRQEKLTKWKGCEPSS